MSATLQFFSVKEHFEGLVALLIILAGCAGHIISCCRGDD